MDEKKSELDSQSFKEFFSRHPKLLIGVVAVVIIPWLLYGCYVFGLSSELKTEYGALGDALGAINTLFTGLAFGGVIITIFLQSEELALQRVELRDTRKVLKDQGNTLRKQKFEQSFFEMLDVFVTLVNALPDPAPRFTDIRGGGGRRSFFRCYDRFHFHCVNEEMGIEKAFKLTFIEYRSNLGHYYRYLYNLVLFVHESYVQDKMKYMRLIRAQLSDYELLLLFYNGLSKQGLDFKPLIEKYHFLNHFSNDKDSELKDLLVSTSHRDLYDSSAFSSDNK